MRKASAQAEAFLFWGRDHPQFETKIRMPRDGAFSVAA
jgi:hypothetical protein